MTEFRQLPGLPPYGQPAIGFPTEWGQRGREGTVVEFTTDDGNHWIGNFAPGLGGIDAILQHPDGKNVLIVTRGTVYLVNPLTRSATELAGAIFNIWPVVNPNGYIFNRQGLAFMRYARNGLLWHTRRISWDGFKDLQLNESLLSGKAFSPIDSQWIPFKLFIKTGKSEGGSYSGPDANQWEQLADS